MDGRLTPFVPRYSDNVSKQYVRCGRFFHNNDHWFFKTREGVDYGPFNDRTECKYAYAEFLEVVAGQNQLGGTNVDFEDIGSGWKVPNINFF